MKNSFSRGVLSCLIAGLLFGAQWPIAGSALTIIDPYWFTLIRYIIVAIILSAILFLKEGKNRQIRKMFKTLGYNVISLERIAFGKIKLGKLKLGNYRELSKEEIEYLRSL